MKTYGYVKCQGCGSSEAHLFYEPKYKGLRGACPYCNTNWPES